jgi:hypothetical protein
MGLLPVAALALSGIGAGVSAYGNTVTQGKENDVITNQINQQKQNAAKGQQIFADSLSKSGADVAKQTTTDAAANRLASYVGGQGKPSGFQASSPSNAVTDAATAGLIDQSNTARSKVGAESDFTFQQGIKNQDTNNLLKILGSQSGIDYSTLQPNLQQASTAGAPYNFAGSTLGSLGALAGLFSQANILKGPKDPFAGTYAVK